MTIKSKTTYDQTKDMAAAISTFAIGGVSCSADSFVVNKVWLAASTFVVKIATFAKPETVVRQCKYHQRI